AYDLFQALRSSRGTLPCVDRFLPGEALSPDFALVLHGDSASGKSLLLRNILAAHLLPRSCGGHGLPSVLIDADQTFEVWLLAKLLKDRARRRLSSEAALEAVDEALQRLLLFRPKEPLELLRQLSQLRGLFARNPTAGLVVVDSMSAWQAMTGAFPRSAGQVMKECWRALGRLQRDFAVCAVLAHRDAADNAVHLSVRKDVEETEGSGRETFAVAPWGRVPNSTDPPPTTFVVSPAGEALTLQ
ncbi:unnamed protein product, partial [Effrenium voratum]